MELRREGGVCGPEKTNAGEKAVWKLLIQVRGPEMV